MIAWVVIVALGVLIYLLIDGDGALPGAKPISQGEPWVPVQGYELRSLVLADYDRAMASNDLIRVAEINGQLAQEATLRSKAVLDAWMTWRHPETGLFPQSEDKPEWNYRNTAADCFGFLIHAAMHTSDDAALALLSETIRKETALAEKGALCQPAKYDTAKPISEDHDELLFASSEYVKDGLISVYERTGDEQVYDRMTEVLDNILANMKHESDFGLLPSTRSEPNGNMLQMCSRLAYREGGEKYADLAGRLADAVVAQMLPANHGLPAHYFDFTSNKVIESKAMLRDHGNELPVGLAEAFALAVSRLDEPEWKERADRWAEPMMNMFELIFAHGINEDGLIGNTIDPATMTLSDTRPSDNWGYIFCGVLLFAESARTHGELGTDRIDALLAKLDGVVEAVSQTNGLPWQGGNFDGYADSLESALYMAAYRPSTAAMMLPWVDRQIDMMYQVQAADGFVGRTYLDGNFIRTSLMYADQKQGGWRLEPWNPGTRVGYAKDESTGKAVLVVATADGYEGSLVPDTSRHAELLGLSWNWPRLNSWPEWSDRSRTTQSRFIEGGVVRDSSELPLTGYRLDLKAGESLVVEFTLKPEENAAGE
ncbi:hypothetical protein HNQ40_002523 [Algisphaera agarilytica]|uniref:Uncharacterized protein n=1 Tax=Algisphaera agarilytica TaxID=1385975 RepID=A0A7X0H7Y0_9BACT|nr:hypothetical protein [Algisphaera agarilytica]